MTSPIDPSLSRSAPLGRADPFGGPGSSSRFNQASLKGPGFAETLRSAVQEVSRLQNDATTAVEQLTLGETDDVTGVMSAVEKSELAFKTLLAIRGKLMSAYDEIRNMPI